MEDYTQKTYGSEWAAEYDEFHAELDPAPIVETIEELAAGRPVLELAIGTGRISVPLAERGVDVRGVDISEEMVARLREKPGGADIPVTMGDFSEVDYGGTFPLIFLAFNTIFGLETQDDQVRLFANVARHLTEEGIFVLEAFVPDVTRYVRDQNISVMKVARDSVDLDLSRHDPVAQRIDVQVATVGAGGTKLRPVRLRYAYPPELDLMARLSGLRLRERWGGWRREEFGPRSNSHVSVYERT